MTPIDLRSAPRRASLLRVLAPCALLAALCLPLAANADEHMAHEKAAKQMAAGAVPRTPAPKGAEVYFITPSNGEIVKSPVIVRFGLKGMGVAPAGVVKPGTGHHHLLIDTGLPKMDQPIPNDETHRHFGGGQTEVAIDLPPGQHTLQLLVGDAAHIPHDPPIVSERITITVD